MYMKYYWWQKFLLWDILLAGIRYYSQEWNITRGNKISLMVIEYYSQELNVTRGYKYITCGNKLASVYTCLSSFVFCFS